MTPLKSKRSSSTLAFLLRFRNDLRPHYTTENACHMTIHAGTTIVICIGRFPIIYMTDSSTCLERSNGESAHTYLWVQQWAWCYSYTVIKDTQSECGQPRHCFQKSLFWSIYTEIGVTFTQIFQTKTGSAGVFKRLSFQTLEVSEAVFKREWQCEVVFIF